MTIATSGLNFASRIQALRAGLEAFRGSGLDQRGGAAAARRLARVEGLVKGTPPDGRYIPAADRLLDRVDQWLHLRGVTLRRGTWTVLPTAPDLPTFGGTLLDGFEEHAVVTSVGFARAGYQVMDDLIEGPPFNPIGPILAIVGGVLIAAAPLVFVVGCFTGLADSVTRYADGMPLHERGAN